jgi:hypothetical protein
MLRSRNPDAAFTLRTGRTDEKMWFETRELMRHGCEPYDAYTKVVFDHEFIYVVRAVTPPAAKIDDWLEKFFDLPFGVKVQIARRIGPTMGPC